MDTLVGFVGKDFVICAADCTSARSILIYKQDEDKIMKLDDKQMLVGGGETGDRMQLSEYLQKNISLQRYRTGMSKSVAANASYVRNEVNLLLGGYDAEKGASLYYIDYLGAMAKSNYAVHGPGASFLLATLDRHWQPDMTLEEAKALMQQCLEVLHTRFIVSQPTFMIKVASASGVETVSLGATAAGTGAGAGSSSA